MSVKANYERELQARGFTTDPAQMRAIDALGDAPTTGRPTKPSAPTA